MASFLDAFLGRSQRGAQPVRPTGSLGEEAGGALRQLFVGGLTGRNPGSFRDQFDERNLRTQKLGLQDALQTGDVDAVSRFDPGTAGDLQSTQADREDARLRALRRRALSAKRSVESLPAEEQDAAYRQRFLSVAGGMVQPEELALINSGGDIEALYPDPNESRRSGGGARTGGGSSSLAQAIALRDAAAASGDTQTEEQLNAYIDRLGTFQSKVDDSTVFTDAYARQRGAITPETVIGGAADGGGQYAPQASQDAYAPAQPAYRQGNTLGDIAARQAAAKAEAETVAKGEGGLAVEDLPLSAREVRRNAVGLAAFRARVENSEDVLDSLINRAGTFTTGGIGAATAAVPGTPAFNFARDLESLDAEIGLSELESLRAQSADGSSGLGQLTQLELESLRARIRNVKQSQNKEQFLKNIRDLRDFRRQSLRRMTAAQKLDSGLPITEDEQTLFSAEERALLNRGGAFSQASDVDSLLMKYGVQ